MPNSTSNLPAVPVMFQIKFFSISIPMIIFVFSTVIVPEFCSIIVYPKTVWKIDFSLHITTIETNSGFQSVLNLTAPLITYINVFKNWHYEMSHSYLGVAQVSVNHNQNLVTSKVCQFNRMVNSFWTLYLQIQILSYLWNPQINFFPNFQHQNVINQKTLHQILFSSPFSNFIHK